MRKIMAKVPISPKVLAVEPFLTKKEITLAGDALAFGVLPPAKKATMSKIAATTPVSGAHLLSHRST
jgi:hypothetical protein